MLTKDTVVMLAEYNDWADRVLFSAIQDLPAGFVQKPRQTLFGSMIGTLNHNYQVDLIWRANLTGEKHGFTSRRDLLHPEFEALIEAQAAINRWYIDWARGQDVESLDERLDFSFVSGKQGTMSRGGMFLHRINHKTYHRGWVAEMFFDAGVNPPDSDLSVYLCSAV